MLRLIYATLVRVLAHRIKPAVQCLAMRHACTQLVRVSLYWISVNIILTSANLRIVVYELMVSSAGSVELLAVHSYTRTDKVIPSIFYQPAFYCICGKRRPRPACAVRKLDFVCVVHIYSLF